MKIKSYKLHKDDDDRLEGVEIKVEYYDDIIPIYIITHTEEIDVYYGTKDNFITSSNGNFSIPDEVWNFAFKWLNRQDWWGKDEDVWDE